ncbi:hypothetical protein SLEP1_g24535 [Rubroshorea leprosula]|uniref:Uncharacterized protein n=1 Tax=Rubroshorea leprosula TaxID=152421 RepID=A0AAV5JFZ5_9ROSI|nr:hypothetical protein SLEP1_g24535 [Rubroshorea leprosula]
MVVLLVLHDRFDVDMPLVFESSLSSPSSKARTGKVDEVEKYKEAELATIGATAIVKVTFALGKRERVPLQGNLATKIQETQAKLGAGFKFKVALHHEVVDSKATNKGLKKLGLVVWSTRFLLPYLFGLPRQMN